MAAKTKNGKLANRIADPEAELKRLEERKELLEEFRRPRDENRAKLRELLADYRTEIEVADIEAMVLLFLRQHYPTAAIGCEYDVEHNQDKAVALVIKPDADLPSVIIPLFKNQVPGCIRVAGHRFTRDEG